jgi:hypothetical protein
LYDSAERYILRSTNQRAQETGGANQPDKSFAVSVPAIYLRKGGGAIRGIGEKFAANPVTATSSLSVPITTSPGRSSFRPQLNLTYDSSSGNGPFGFGWSLLLPSITRKTDRGLPKYQVAENSDVFILSGALDIVPEFKTDEDGTGIIQNGKYVIWENHAQPIRAPI